MTCSGVIKDNHTWSWSKLQTVFRECPVKFLEEGKDQFCLRDRMHVFLLNTFFENLLKWWTACGVNSSWMNFSIQMQLTGSCLAVKDTIMLPIKKKRNKKWNNITVLCCIDKGPLTKTVTILRLHYYSWITLPNYFSFFFFLASQ